MTHKQVKRVHEGEYVVEVEVEVTEADGDTGWGPYLSLAEAKKLDETRRALRRGDLKAASQMSRVFRLSPVAV